MNHLNVHDEFTRQDMLIRLHNPLKARPDFEFSVLAGSCAEGKANAESGLPLPGENTLAWARFLRRTLRELEDFYWENNLAV